MTMAGAAWMPQPCRHRSHRVPVIPSDARLLLPECTGREPWLEARRAGIGGSDVGALVGVSEYETPFDVWNTKIHGGKDLSGEAAIEWGHRLEEVVAQKTAEEIGLTSRPGGGLWADPVREFLRVTPDRFACRRRSWVPQGVIECKTAGDDDGWENGTILPGGAGDGSAPLSYQAQVQWQLGILGLERGWLGCLVLGAARDFYVVEIAFDRPWFEELVDAAERFWHVNVLGDEPPMHDYRHPRTEELAKQLHPNVTRLAVDLPEDAQEWLDAYLEARAEFERAETRLSEIKNYFRIQVADAGAGYIGDRRVVSYPEVRQSRIDVEALRERFPEVAEQVTVQSTHRRLYVRPNAKGER